jgi:L,D-peptidoglycan transpeptidase YkuD (ErfK/YbiS/YcfS/YnhG family)
MQSFIVHSASKRIQVSDTLFPCSIGRSGAISAELKQEGDGFSPTGSFPIRQVFYRADRIPAPQVNHIPIRALTPQDGWCDDLNDAANYNRHVALPYARSHEELWRDDHVYDIIVVLGHNDDPVRLGKGSAIFMHIATDDFAPTAGCVAMKIDDLLQLLQQASAGSTVEIQS